MVEKSRSVEKRQYKKEDNERRFQQGGSTTEGRKDEKGKVSDLKSV